MVRQLLDDNDQGWEKLLKYAPYALLDHHPNGKLVAMQVVDPRGYTFANQAAIWSVETQKIVWWVDGTNAICWVNNGKAILIIREVYKMKPNYQTNIVTPLQSEFTYLIEQLSWPECQLISSYNLEIPTGWPVCIVASPTKKLCCFVWQDQTEAGIEFVSWDEGILKQIKGQGYYGHSNLIEGPIFSPDGCFIVFCYTKQWWWVEPFLRENVEIGCIVICDVNSWNYQKVDIITSVSAEWTPNNFRDIRDEIIQCPEFVDIREFCVKLPTGENKTFLISPTKGTLR